MTHVANSSTSAISAYRDNLYHQSQQAPWTFNNDENRTAVTSSLPISEATEVQIMHGVDIHKMYRERSSEISQVTPVSQVNWHFLNNWEVLPSSPEASQDLVKAGLIWSEKNTLATLLSESQFQWLKKHYIFRNDTEIKDVLREHLFLAQLLLDTYSKIEAHFPDAQVFLDVVIDYEAFGPYPEAENNGKELVVSISTHFPPKEAIEALKNFYNQWWFTASKDAKDKISIGLEYL